LTTTVFGESGDSVKTVVQPPADQPHPHRLEEPDADRREGCARQLGAFGNRFVGDGEDRVPVRSVDRQREGERDVRHARQRTEARREIGEEGDAARRRVLVAGQLNARRQQMCGPDAGLDLRQLLQRAHHQSGAGEQHERQRGFDHHQT